MSDDELLQRAKAVVMWATVTNAHQYYAWADCPREFGIVPAMLACDTTLPRMGDQWTDDSWAVYEAIRRWMYYNQPLTMEVIRDARTTTARWSPARRQHAARSGGEVPDE